MARYFNGTTDKIDFGTIDLQFPVSTPDSLLFGTASAWINPAIVSGNQQVFRVFNASPSIVFGLLLQNTTLLGQNQNLDISSSVTVAANKWYNVVVAIEGKSGTNSFISVNGTVTTGTDNYISVSANAAVQAAIGYRVVSGTQFFNGNIADFAFWNAFLTQSEALALNRGAPPGRIRPGNLRLWQQTDGWQSPEPDASGWGRAGFVTGTTRAASPSYETFARPPRRLLAAVQPAATILMGQAML